MLGQLVKTLVDGIEPAGYKSVVWNADCENGRQVASGIYFSTLRVRAASGTNIFETKKLLLVR